MSRLITDGDLMTWEVFASSGPYGYPIKPKIVFLCLSDPDRRSRYVVHDGDNADAERAIHSLGEGDLVALLKESTDLD